MKRFFIIFGAVLYLILSIEVGASDLEVDQFSVDQSLIQNSINQLNLKLNQYMVKGISRANTGAESCGVAKLYAELYSKLAKNSLHSNFIRAVEDSNNIDKLEVPRSESIFEGWRFLDGFRLWNPVNDLVGTPLAPILRLNNFLIGLDKLQNMFSNGFDYFEKVYLEGEGIKETLLWGAAREKGSYLEKYLGTGVFSYADLLASFQGMRFWNAIVNKGEDPLGALLKGETPYVKCIGDRWVLAQPVDLADFVDAGFDESFNCSRFLSKGAAERVFEKIARINSEGERVVQCPRSEEQNLEIHVKYGPWARWLINENGLGALDFDHEFLEH